MKETFDEDYFERGIETGKSLYTNYRWEPELTIPMAMTYVDHLPLGRFDNILDFGCAKGFVVKALRLLNRNAWGCDISNYAIKNADPSVKDYVRHCNGKLPFDEKFEWVIAKDVFEHIKEDDLNRLLIHLRPLAKQMFVIVPLGKDDKYIVPAYHLDKTHKLAKTVGWWENHFVLAGWYVKQFEYRVRGIKDNWELYREGNGFFIVK